MNVLGGDAVHIRGGDFFNFGRKLVEPVSRIAIELISHALGQNLVGRVEPENECIEDRVLRLLDFDIGNGLAGEIVDVFIQSFDGFDRALALGSDDEALHAGMAEIGTDAAAHFIGKAATSADVVEQPRRKTAAEGLVENGNRVEVGIVARGAERHHPDIALIYVFFGNEVVTWLGWMVLNFILGKIGAFRPGVKGRVQLGFHGRGIEVSADAENDLVGMNVLAVPIDQILARNGRDGGVLGFAGVRIVPAIGENGGLASGNLADIVVAPRNCVVGLLLREIELVGAKLGVL